MSDLPPPNSSGSTPLAPADATTSWWRRRLWKLPVWAWILIGLFIVIAAAGAASGDEDPEADQPLDLATDGSDEATPSTAMSGEQTSLASTPSAPATTVSTETSAPETTTPPETTQAATTVPETTQAVTTVPETTSAPESEVGTRESPVPIGQPAEVGAGWTVVVNSVDLDANEEVAAANQFNDPPPAGKQYVVVNITATYDGDEASDSAGVQIKALGEGTNAVSDIGTAENFAVGPEPAYDSFAEVFKGGSTSGNVVLEVPVVDIDTLVLIGEAFFSFDDSRAFFAVS